MRVEIKPTLGEIPRLETDHLPPGAAQYAKDVSLVSGAVRGLKARATTGMTSSGVISSAYVHPITNKWFAWNTVFPVDVVTGPIVDDQYYRFYYVDGASVRVARGDTGTNGEAPSTSYVVGVPAPANAMQFNSYASTFPSGADQYVFVPGCSPALISDAIGYTVTEETAGQSYRIDLTAVPPCAGATVGEDGTIYAVTTGTDVISEYPTPMVVHALSATPTMASDTLYILAANWALGAVGGASISLLNGGSPITRTFYRLSDGSYSTSASATPLSQETPADVRAFQVQMTISNAGTFVGKLALTVDNTEAMPAAVGEGGWSAILEKVTDLQYRVRVFHGSAGQGSVETRAYVYTFVNDWGEEGPPSAPLLVDVTPGLDILFDIFSDADSTYKHMYLIRLYRTNTGSSSTEYQFVKEVSKTSLNDWTTITDDVPSSSLGEVISTTGFSPPPSACIAIETLANGVTCVAKGNELWFSEPYLPYAYKPGNVLALAHQVVGMCAYENNLFVTTTASPRLITGVSPDAMVESVLPEVHAGVSRQSIARIGNKIAYLSHDGIVVAQGLDTTIGVSLKLFTRDTWRARYATLLPYAWLAAHDGALVCTFGKSDQTTQEGFVLRLDESDGVFTRFSETVVAQVPWEANDALYHAYGQTLYAYGSGSATLPWVWWSKDFVLPEPHCFGVCEVHGSGSLTIAVYSGGALAYTKAITGTGVEAWFRLPANKESAVWSVKVTGAADSWIKHVTLTTSPEELVDG